MFIRGTRTDHKFIRNFLFAIFLSFYGISKAVSNDLYEIIEVKSKSELWLNAGMYSYHYDKNQNLNNNNLGFGIEYRFSTVSSVTVGGFKNSNNSHSNYAGLYWQPISIKNVNVGLVGGGFSGYKSTNNGGWFPAIFPALTLEKKWIGLNLFLIPTIPDKVQGAVSLQLKLKILD